MIIVKSTNGEDFLIDECDKDFVFSRNWFVQGSKKHRYAATNVKIDKNKYKIKYLHRLLLGVTDSKIFVDHKNGNTLDCTRGNLRLSDPRLNQANCRVIKGISKYKGVSFEEGKWRARIRIKGKKAHLGLFLLEIDAAKAYNDAALLEFGEHAFLNKI